MKVSSLFFVLVAGTSLSAVAAPQAHAQDPALIAAPVAASQAMQEAARLQAALNHFDSALASHDFGQLQSLGIKASSAKGWQKFFKNNPGATVTDDCPASALAILGDKATWSCTETATVISEGKLLPFPLVVRFTFARQDGVWTILDRR